MPVTTLETKILVDEVTDVTVTTIEQQEDGQYIRELRIFGTPPGAGQQPPMVLVVRLAATSREAIEIATPNSSF